MIITTTVRIYEYEKPQQFQCLLLSKIDVMDKWTSWTTTLHDIWDPIWMVGETTSSLKRTLKIAWRVRRWRSVNTKRGFLGCCGCSGESSFLLQAEKYREKRVFQQDSWNSSKSFFPALLLRRRPYFFALEKWLLKLQLFVVPICNQMQLVFYSTLLNLTTYCWPHFLTDHLSHLSRCVQNAFAFPLFLSLQAVALFLLRVIFPKQQNRNFFGL